VSRFLMRHRPFLIERDGLFRITRLTPAAHRTRNPPVTGTNTTHNLGRCPC
jgi:hypothetical protein